MKRRQLLGGAAAALAAPSIVRAEPGRALRFVPEADVTVIDPVWTTATVTRNHGYLVFDTLYAQDDIFAVALVHEYSNGGFNRSPQRLGRG